MFSDEELALIDAIHADPKSDAPRLTYAHWLEMNGAPEHAELIRLQCQEPYIAISNGDPDNPRKSYRFDFPSDDPTARTRLNRMLEIFPAIYRSDRYTAQRKLYYYEEHYRGLPLIHVGNEDENRIERSVLSEMGTLSRVDLTIATDCVAALLAHPIMPRVDKLHIWPRPSWDVELDQNWDINAYCDRFWVESIPVLAASPVIDRLLELNPCGCHSTGKLTEQSRRNLALCQELLEPKVYVEYSY